LVPGLTQQMIVSLQQEIKKSSVTNLVSSITAAAQQANQNGQVSALAGQTTVEQLAQTKAPNVKPATV
jgi:hypothetical protein